MRLIVLFLAAMFTIFGCERDPRRDVMGAQGALIAQWNGWDSGAVSDWDRSVDAATKVTENLFHVEGWFTTQGGSAQMSYQMIVEKRGDVLANTCFVTDQDIEFGEAYCF